MPPETADPPLDGPEIHAAPDLAVPLRAGPLRLVFDRGELRWIRLGEREVIPMQCLNPFLHRFTKLRKHLDLIRSMNCANKNLRASSDEAPILIAPVHILDILGRLFFDHLLMG